LTSPASYFKIHGDNIVECERMLSLIVESLDSYDLVVEGPKKSIITPCFEITLKKLNRKLFFTFFPGYKRWNQDIITEIRNMGGVLREAADVILTQVQREHEVQNEYEIPLIAIEFCGALPAGNQAWQRNGRAYSFGMARLPYFYVADIGGFELNADRERKSTRLPNPAVPFSYLTLSNYLDTTVLPVFVPSPGASLRSRQVYSKIFGWQELTAIVEAIILSKDYSDIKIKLENKTLETVRILARSRKKKDTITVDQWFNAYEQIRSEHITLTSYLLNNARLPWTKRVSIPLTETVKNLMENCSEISIGLTSTSLPLCIVKGSDRTRFGDIVQSIYNDIPQDFIQWVTNDEQDLVICWVMGFKPKGDDARPDRGLPPLGRMLIGPETHMLTVIYGPAKEEHWRSLDKKPRELMQRNGIWEAILTTSDAILIDSKTMRNLTKRAYTSTHWSSIVQESRPSKFNINPIPECLGENDVDTVIHLLFRYFGSNSIFEGMCNPPGGDWSGISIISRDERFEYRWLHLPRVGEHEGKRPDHVFEIFQEGGKPIILCVESKETASSVETNIGERLVRYVETLLNSRPSIERVIDSDPSEGESQWIHSEAVIRKDDFHFGSAVACLLNGPQTILAVKDKANVDIVFGFIFNTRKTSCTLVTYPCTPLGEEVHRTMQEIQKEGYGINVVRFNSSDTKIL